MLGLVTAAVAASLDPDLLPLEAAMGERLGADGVRIVAWDDSGVDWSAFDAVVLRSTWDYSDRLDEFLDWVGRVQAVTELVNSSDVIRWSADKRYLRDLAAEGIEITPTTFVVPGEKPPSVSGLHVVKPTVGAGSSGARRCEPGEVASHVALLHGQGRTAMVQPYLDRLDELGETALCFVASSDSPGEFVLSHTFRKAAILTSTEVEQQDGLFAVEQIDERVPSAAELDLARRALATEAIRALGPIMFARVDVAPHLGVDGVDGFVVMEVELIEPSFYFETARGSVDTFADAIVSWLPPPNSDDLTGHR